MDVSTGVSSLSTLEPVKSRIFLVISIMKDNELSGILDNAKRLIPEHS